MKLCFFGIHKRSKIEILENRSYGHSDWLLIVKYECECGKFWVEKKATWKS